MTKAKRLARARAMVSMRMRVCVGCLLRGVKFLALFLGFEVIEGLRPFGLVGLGLDSGFRPEGQRGSDEHGEENGRL